MHGLLEKRQGHTVAVAIATCFGASQGIPVFSGSGSAWPLVLVAGLAGGVGGLFFLSWLIRHFSHWFGSQVELRAIRTAVGLSLFPWTFFFLIFSYFILAAESSANVIEAFPIFFAVFLYGFVILLISLATALRLTFLKAFACLSVSFLVSMFLLIWIIRLLAGWVTA